MNNEGGRSQLGAEGFVADTAKELVGDTIQRLVL